MFEGVNEIAVLGTTFFMMAVATVWYSPMLFGTVWMKATRLTDEDTQKAKKTMWLQILLTFVSYASMLLLLGYVIAFAPTLGLTAFNASLLLVGFVWAVLIAFIIWELKPFSYYFIHAGFFGVFIIVGTFLLDYWPW